MLGTIIIRREQFHSNIIGQAVIARGKTAKRQALVLGDSLAIIGIMLVLAAIVVLFARKGPGGGAAAAH